MILSFSAMFGGQYAVVDLWVNILNVMEYINVMIYQSARKQIAPEFKTG